MCNFFVKLQIMLTFHPEVMRIVENWRVCPLNCLKGMDCYFLTPINFHHAECQLTADRPSDFLKEVKILILYYEISKYLSVGFLKKKPKQNRSRGCQTVFSITVKGHWHQL